MKKLLLSAAVVCASLAFSATAWAGVVTTQTPDGNGYLLVTSTVTDQTTNMGSPNANGNMSYVYTDAQGVTFTLTSPVAMTFDGNNGDNHGLKFFENDEGQRRNVAFTWGKSYCGISLTKITLSTRVFAGDDAYCAINADATTTNGTEIHVGSIASINGWDNRNSNNKNVTYTGTLDQGETFFSYFQAKRPGSYADTGSAYLNSIKVDYVLTYTALDFTEFDEAYNKVATIYQTLSPEEQTNSDFGKAVKAAEEFRNANDGAIDVVNGTKPARVDEETEKLRALLYTENISDNADMSFCIKNNSFEMGDLTGWTVSSTAGDDTKVYQNSGNHATSNGDGNYLFNTYYSRKTNASGLGSTNYDFYEGHRLSQTITGLPNGTYKVSALFSSDHENTTYLTINGVNAEGVQSPNKDTFAPATATVEVTDGTLTIGAIGGEKTIQGKKGIGGSAGDKFTYNTWYRADNFQLTLLQPATYRLSEAVDYVKPESERKEVILKKEMKAGKYSAVCLPFNYTPSDWTVYTLASEEEQNNGSTLAITLEPVTGELTAGHPYFVCPASDYETITANDVTLIDEPATVDSHMPLVGVFEATPLNAGDIYISTTADEMTFKYLKEGASATLKPYRAYFKLTDGVSASTFRINTEGADVTSILNVISEKQNEGIYDLNGRRTNAIKAGAYVVNGKKVIIK